jgi:glutathione S-transferase
MPEGRLFIGTRRYSSWSLRGWLAVHLAGLDVEDIVIPLLGSGGTPAVAAVSPSGLVPYLEHAGLRIWETLAICEYCAEIKPDLWPADRAARTHARVISAEMHAGFRGLREAMPMVLNKSAPGAGQTPHALKDIARIEALWRETRAEFGAGGPFLFGAAFNAADAMFAPVVARLLTYQPPIAADTSAYCDAVRAHPLVTAWYEAAAQEPAEWHLGHYEHTSTA